MTKQSDLHKENQVIGLLGRLIESRMHGKLESQSSIPTTQDNMSLLPIYDYSLDAKIEVPGT